MRRWPIGIAVGCLFAALLIAVLRAPNHNEERFLFAQFKGLDSAFHKTGEGSESWCFTGAGESHAIARQIERALQGRPGWKKLSGKNYWMYVPYGRPALWPAAMGFPSPFDLRRHLSFFVAKGKATMKDGEKPPKTAWTYVSLVASRPVPFPKGNATIYPWKVLPTP